MLDEFVAEALDARAAARWSGADSWAEAVYRAMAAFVEHLVAHQALLRIAFIDLFEVGPGDDRAHDALGRRTSPSC